MAGGDPVNYKNKKAGLKGLMTQMAGTSGPKTGYIHSKLLSKKQDISGRGTIYAAPDVGFNEAKIPRAMLNKMWEPHIKRDLASKGYSVAEAKQAHESLSSETPSQAAVASFNKVCADTPIILNRAPTLMKTNIIAMKAVPTDEKTIGLNILHLPGFAADYDGDALSVYSPVSQEAIQEAKDKLLPENHLHDARIGKGAAMYKPQHEAILGSVYLTQQDDKQKVVKFRTEADALAALKAGDIKENTPIQITNS